MGNYFLCCSFSKDIYQLISLFCLRPIESLPSLMLFTKWIGLLKTLLITLNPVAGKIKIFPGLSSKIFAFIPSLSSHTQKLDLPDSVTIMITEIYFLWSLWGEIPTEPETYLCMAISLNLGLLIGGSSSEFIASKNKLSIDVASVSIAPSLGAGKQTSKSCVTELPTKALAFLKCKFEACSINLKIKGLEINGMDIWLEIVRKRLYFPFGITGI